MSHRTKIVDKQMKKLQYITHVKRLQQLSSQRNPFQKSLRKQREEIECLIKKSHKLHLSNLKVSSKTREKTLANTQRKNYQSVKSVVKMEQDRRILNIPSKIKPDNFYRDMENLKIVSKILNAKSQFDFKRQNMENLSKRMVKRRLDKSQDFSVLYENLFQNRSKLKKIKLYLSKDKLNIRIMVKFIDQQNIFLNKSSNPYLIVLQNKNEYKESKNYSLDQITFSQFIFELPKMETNIIFVEIISQKKIPRFKIKLKNQDFQDLGGKVVTKAIQDMKEKAIGLASIQAKKGKAKKQPKEETQNTNLASFQTTNAEPFQNMCKLNSLTQNICNP